MPAKLTCPMTIYQGETLYLSASFYEVDGDEEAVEAASFFIRSPSGVETEIAAVLSTDRTSATAEYDLPGDIVAGSWKASVATGGALKQNFDRASFEVIERVFEGADPPMEAYWERVYYGVGAAGITTPAALMALGHADLENTHDWMMTLTPDEQHVYVCYPATWGISVTSQGIGFASKTARTANLTAYDGTTVSYTVLESYNALGDGTTRTYDATENA